MARREAPSQTATLVLVARDPSEVEHRRRGVSQLRGAMRQGRGASPRLHARRGGDRRAADGDGILAVVLGVMLTRLGP